MGPNTQFPAENSSIEDGDGKVSPHMGIQTGKLLLDGKWGRVRVRGSIPHPRSIIPRGAY
jgi:hypothetical protein